MGDAGLSPHARGNRALTESTAFTRRSIPACAGEPTWWTAASGDPVVYPRVRGGTWQLATAAPRGSGLSPRARGNHRRSEASRAFGRSIPACAGEPTPGRTPRRVQKVYPRVRGGTAKGASALRSRSGLSPRARGNRERRQSADKITGSIPACAGEPGALSVVSAQFGVYPRVRGGTAIRSRESAP